MTHQDLALRDPRSARGLALVGQAFRRAAASQLHPRMIAALFLPFVIAFLGAVLLLWFFWQPLTGWLDQEASSWGLFNTIDGWLVAVGLFSLKLWLVPLLAAGLLLPMAGILGLVIAAVFVMPIVLRHLEHREYRGLNRQGRNTTALGVWNAIWVGLLFCLGWLFTMPLWLIPPMALVLPVFWWAFALNRMLRVDAMIEHASPAERRLLWRRHNRQLWLIAACLAVVNLIPLFWLVMPVFSALVYAHFCLEAIRRLRAETVIDV
ncbi:EI24 domain-containing protein [Castellaniella denitrificans]|uniref:EI24 domain-containing protein n=1 Tax=Castellaniella denitrificans TaxID=56119 RepID=UPI001AC164E7|nr:EI24 domain-containing protein [Burkholderiales bacterium]